jgi:hypothetical protein
MATVLTLVQPAFLRAASAFVRGLMRGSWPLLPTTTPNRASSTIIQRIIIAFVFSSLYGFDATATVGIQSEIHAIVQPRILLTSTLRPHAVIY